MTTAPAADAGDSGATEDGGTAPCGNGRLDRTEACDGSEFGTADCQSATDGALPEGTLRCHRNCTFDMSRCAEATDAGPGGTGGTGGSGGSGGSGGDGGPGVVCGNGDIDLGEACDGTNLAGQTCAGATAGALPSGPLACAANCTLDTSDCSETCGNGAIDVGESCDGINLAAQNCATATSGALASGTLSCTSSCTLDTSGCTDTEGDGGTCGSGTETGPCKAYTEGVYAMHIVLDAHWGDTDPLPVADNGRGSIEIYMMGTIDGVCDDGTGSTGTLQVCGMELPPLWSDVTCNVYQMEFPDSIWESPNMPRFTTTGMTSGFEVGDVLTLAKVTGLVGISLTDRYGAWPTTVEAGTFTCPEGSGVQCYPDHDDDGKAGVTVIIRNDGVQAAPDGCNPLGSAPFEYRAAPTETLGGVGYSPTTRTEHMQIGLRLAVGGGGTISECSATAAGQGPAVADKPDSRLFSCQTAAGAECSPAQAMFVDENLSEYTVLAEGAAPPTELKTPKGYTLDQTPSQGPRARLVRIGDLGQSFTCAQVRNASFPAWAPALYESPDYH